MPQQFSNAARSTLATGISASATSLAVLDNALAFPVANAGTNPVLETNDWFKVVLQDAAYFEVVYVRTHAAGSLTMSDILRGQEGSTARAFAPGTVVGLRQTAGDAAAALIALMGKQSAMTFSETAPLNPRVGDEWFVPSEGDTYRYFHNAVFNEYDWVQTDANGVMTISVAALPPVGRTNTIYILEDRADQAVYWNGTAYRAFTGTLKKKLLGTTASAANGTVSLAHGLTGSKIVGLEVLAGTDTGRYAPGHPTPANAYGVHHDATNVVVTQGPSAGGNVNARPLVVLVSYEL